MLLFAVTSVNAQSWIEKLGKKTVDRAVDRAKQKTEDKVNEKVDKSVDKVFEETEDAVTGKNKDKTKEKDNDGDSVEKSGGNKPQAAPAKFQSFGQYDFIPGDKILFYEDFSQAAIGDFPLGWTSDATGEVRTVNNAPGKWFYLTDGFFCYTKPIDLPKNFIIEFDFIPEDEFGGGFALQLYQDDQNKEFSNNYWAPGINLGIIAEGWECTNPAEEEGIKAYSTKVPLIDQQPRHVILWAQDRRARVYTAGQKVIDSPTLISTTLKPNRLKLYFRTNSGHGYISNIKITTAAPDTRSKLITEGKLVTYGITFDVGKDIVKPESYGVLKEVATALKEAPAVRIRIIGHTDSDGDAAANLDLSRRRAASVKNELAKSFGIDASRIETDGKGEGDPIAPNATAQDKAKNRRVEFVKL